MSLTLCTQGGDPLALGPQMTRRRSEDRSRASPGYVRELGWLLQERAGCIL